MSKTKSKSKRKTGAAKAKKPAPVTQVPVGDEAIDEMSAGEKFLISAKPYWAHALLGVLSIILAGVLWTVWSGIQQDSASAPWQALSTATTQANLSRDPSSWKEMATEYEGEAAGNWALLMAANDEFNRGVMMLANDRAGGFKLVGRAEESIQKVIDAPAASKTPAVQQRSLFMMGQIKETLGKFDQAKEMYQTLIEQAPKSPFIEHSKRGAKRCADPEIVAFYKKFREFEEIVDTGDAPGPLVPDAPKLDLNPIQLDEGEKETFVPDAKNEEMSDLKPDSAESESSAADKSKEEMVDETEAKKTSESEQSDESRESSDEQEAKSGSKASDKPDDKPEGESEASESTGEEKEDDE